MGINIDDLIKSYRGNDDFGFTVGDQHQISNHKETLKKIEELIMPLLANLADTADKDTIYWPNRGPELKKKIEEFLKLTRS